MEVTASADSGAEVCRMSEEMYEDVTAAGLPALELTIWGSHSSDCAGKALQKNYKQVLLQFTLGTDTFEQNCLYINYQLNAQIITYSYNTTFLYMFEP